MPSGHVKKGAILHSSINRIYTIGGASLKNKFLKAPSERQNVLARLAILMWYPRMVKGRWSANLTANRLETKHGLHTTRLYGNIPKSACTPRNQRLGLEYIWCTIHCMETFAKSGCVLNRGHCPNGEWVLGTLFWTREILDMNIIFILTACWCAL